MALSTRLMMRQGQALVMTPQLLQAIKLLQFSHLELSAFVQDELDRNPLLERADDRDNGPEAAPAIDRFAEAEQARGAEMGEQPDWAGSDLAVDSAQLSADLGTDVSNAFDADAPPTPAAPAASGEETGLTTDAWSGGANGGGAGGGASDGEAPNLEAYVAAKPTLAEHLTEQLNIACADPTDRLIGRALIDSLDEAGYFRDDLAETAERLGAPLARVERMLAQVQTFDPSGVGARDLAECLAIQLRECDRYDPAMQALIANLPLLAKREFATLRRLCGVDDEDILDMVAEIRRLDPKPGRAFGGETLQPVAPDVIVRAATDGSWRVELNTEVLPRVLVNQTYAATVNAARVNEADKSFLTNCLQNANWLTKSLEQRARTILKVASEIVRQQDGFLAHGVEHLRPLNLRTIADAIGMHESTVSRVTSNKYMATPRGLFEMKYFFTASIAAQAGGEAHSAEAVRFRIKQMIDQEPADAVLSDDAIVTRLKDANIDIARRTVAKYRESLRIPSSVERRREKTALAAQPA
ncbi:MAG: RNA polymerase factor sigma-54 [Rhodoblastus sp.]|nr:RNA polymerase factor sigma-54 [Rhodoblastus sp.]MCO5089071.1 RNA polymerase factor sigma-54 [Methylobacteriaceae bacterium]